MVRRAFVVLLLSVSYVLGGVRSPHGQDCRERTAHFLDAVRLFRNSQYSRAGQLLYSIVRQKECSEYETIVAHQLLGEIEYLNNRVDQAKDHILQAIRINPGFDYIDPNVAKSRNLYYQIRAESFCRLVIESEPSGALCEIDGLVCGLTPLLLEHIEKGGHKIRIHPYDARHGKLDTVTIVYEDARKLFSLPIKRVKVRIDTEPQQAQVYYENEAGRYFAGLTPLADEFEWGMNRNVCITKVGYETVRFGIRAEEDEIEKRITLKPETGRLRLKCKPANSIVFIDGEGARVPYDGILDVDLPVGLHTIEVQSSDGLFEPKTVQVGMVKGCEREVVIQLDRRESQHGISMSNCGSTGNLYVMSPEGLGRGFGLNFFSDYAWLQPHTAAPVDSSDAESMFKGGVSIIAAGNSWITIGQTFDCFLRLGGLNEFFYPRYGTDDGDIELAVESKTLLKFTFLQEKNIVWSIQGEIDYPLYSSAYFPGYSHPLLVLDDETAGIDLKGSSCLALRGFVTKLRLSGGIARYNDERGEEYDGIGEESYFYGGSFSVGRTHSLFIQFLRQVFPVDTGALMASEEMPMKLSVGAGFLVSGLFFNIGLSVDLSEDDAGTVFNPTLVYPKYTVHTSIGYARGVKRAW